MFVRLLVFCLVLSVPVAEAWARNDPEPDYDLSVSFDIAASRISGEANVKARAGEKMVFKTDDIVLSGVTLNGDNIDYVKTDDERISIVPSASGILNIRYEGYFKRGPLDDRSDPAAKQNIIDSRGVFLQGTWYPRPEKPLQYRVRALLPNGYEAVAEAEYVKQTVRGNHTEFLFRFDRPLQSVNLIASGRYRILADRVNGIELFAYFFQEHQGQAAMSLRLAKKFFEFYEKQLGKYPYPRFSIVESVLQLGYSAPTFMLLGQSDVLAPSISERTVSRELLRQWFGNLVFVDFETGNWADGLITYLADHRLEEQKDRGEEFRKRLLLDYRAYVKPENEISLRAFRLGTDPAARAIGNGKGALLFHMLKQSMEEESFFNALRDFVAANQYSRAGWDELRTSFEKRAKKDYSPFFRQWLEQKGLPELIVEKGSVRWKNGEFKIDFSVLQKQTVYNLDLQEEISLTRGGMTTEPLVLDSAKKNVMVRTKEEPRSLTIDHGYNVARTLSDDETPPAVAAVLGESSLLIVMPVSNEEAYKPAITLLKSTGAREKAAADFKDADTKNASLVIFGSDNPVIPRLFGAARSSRAGFSIVVRKNPWNSAKVVAIINSRSAAETQEALRVIPDYAEYSIVSFDKGKNIEMKLGDSERGIRMELREPAAAFEPSSVKTVDDAIAAANGKKIVYVGERHDEYSHHMVQLQVLESFYEKEPKIAVGMEMFQRPFQNVLDDYLAGSIDEKQFLAKSEYFKRWGFDYNLYKPILDFCRSRKIPVVALNLKREIVDKVSKGGIDSLEADEKKDVPAELDFSDNAYRERLKDVFSRHKKSEEKNFDFFYQAQVLWDETMSLSIDEFLKKKPEYRMLVLAGNGHIVFGSGIPKRTYRRNSIPYYIIVNDEDIAPGVADYIVQPQPLEGEAAPKLMAVLSVENNRISVKDLAPNSVSKTAGIEVGDMILSLDGSNVASVEEIKLILFYKQKGDILKVRVLRKRFLRAAREMEIKVTL